MKKFCLVLFLLALLLPQGVQAQNTAINTDTDDDEFYFDDNESDSDVQERLEKAREEDAANASYTKRNDSLLSDAQRNQLNAQSTSIEPIRQTTIKAPETKTKSRYDKQKHDWGFKDPFETKTETNTSSIEPAADRFGTRTRY